MAHYQISREMHDFCKTFEKDLTKPQMGRVKELIHGIIRGQKAILSEVARQNRSKDEKKAVRRQVQQYSEMLLGLPLERMMRRKLANFKLQISEDTPLYFDLTDITKEFHKGMDCIGSTWDGSEGRPGKGYEMVDVSIGYEGYCTNLLRQFYSTIEDGYLSQTKEIEKAILTLIYTWGEMKGTLFFDKGADNDNLIKMFLIHQVKFVIRMNTNRGKQDRIFFDENGEPVRMMEGWDNPQGMTTWQNKRKKKDVRLVQLQWKKVWREYDKKMVSLYLVWAHRTGDPRPAVFLTNRTIENEADAAKVYHQYFERGREEAVFKCNKDKLGMEKVQLESFEKVKQMMLIYVLVDQFLYKLHKMALEVGSVVYCLLKSFLVGMQRSINKWSIIDWYDDVYKNLECEYIKFRRRYPHEQATSQPTLFSNPIEKW